MPTKEEWVARFEEKYGRKPSPQEFLEAKKNNFDISALVDTAEEVYEVAEESAVDEISSSQTGQVFEMAEEAEVASPVTLNPEPVQPSPVTPQASPVQETATQANLAQEQWVAAFEKYIGRKPSPQEFMAGKSSGFALTSINQFLQQPASVAKKTRKPVSVLQKVLYSVGALLVIGLVAAYLYGTQYYSQQAVAERYLQEVDKNAEKAITDYEVWSDTKQSITKDQLNYLDMNQRQTVPSEDIMDEGRMVQVGNTLLVFPNWKVAVQPVNATVTVNTKGLSLDVNGKQIEKSTTDSYKKKLERLYPGTYSFVAKGKVDGQDVEVSSEEKLSKDTTVDLAVKYLNFTVQSNLSDGDLYVGSKKVGTLTDGRLEVSNLAVTSAASVYVKKSFSEKDSIKSETKSIADITDGDTVTIDASGVLDRDVADRVIESAYSKLSSYSYNHTTPDGLKDVFSGGADNKFYKDVKNTIDTNTTGAKNRSADSISFSDVDVTKVTQTGPKTYKVDFTVVYDFYYGYDSKFKTSGDIIQKLTWSADVEYVGDKDSDGSNSSDYRITSSSDDSKVIENKNTVD